MNSLDTLETVHLSTNKCDSTNKCPWKPSKSTMDNFLEMIELTELVELQNC